MSRFHLKSKIEKKEKLRNINFKIDFTLINK